MTTWNLNGMKHHVLICNGSSCNKKGGEEVTVALRDEITKQGLDQTIHTTRTRCNGRCKDACVAIVYPEGAWYSVPDEQIARSIVTEHLRDGVPLQQHLIYEYSEEVLHSAGSTERVRGIEKDKKKETV
ncbi:cobalamin biosynthesis protein [Fictibacillus macauensis ZFHKF-1]|uniref:Cobalamin biosynthesis protein n=1 Tax=Fictibacillus macauensis ZFHKF-1 TaxID=1196324 RepID=I8UHX3_9BACL|nr:(2Fe-2S) ferredoxin domain-containing protein [Fictibacillus macauensis]EIT86470.1 cobalamin biosynthesis protein [Fictibacillus macauensis ZFHKF-1]